MPQNIRVDVLPCFLFPPVDHALQVMCHPGHRDITQQRQGTRYGDEFLTPATAGRYNIAVVYRAQ